MIAIVVVVVLVIAGVVAFAVKSKSSKASGEFLASEAPRASAAAAPLRAAEPAAPSAEPAPSVVAGPEAVDPAPIDDEAPNLDALVFADRPGSSAVTADPSTSPEPNTEPNEPAPVVVSPEVVPAPEPRPVAEDEPEPMVRARIAPTPEKPSDAEPVDDDDDRAVLSRFKAPGARVASIAIPALTPTRSDAGDDAPTLIVPDGAAGPGPEVPIVTSGSEVSPSDPSEPAVGTPEAAGDTAGPEPEAEPAPELDEVVTAEQEVEPEPAVAVAEIDVDEIAASDVADESPEASDIDAGGSLVLEPAPLVVDETEPLVIAETEPEPEPAVAEAPPALTGAAAMSPVLEDPIVLTDEPVPPIARLQPEPELDPVDHVLKALITRAKEKQVGIAEVAAELVEQANLEDRDIDEVLADLVVRADDDTVDSSERLEELTLFNDSVPRRPGQLTDFDRLDKNARKKVIIRVLCLLVAMQEDNRLKPSEPRSEAETRHWPLARAVWPVPVADADEGGDDADGDKKLPGRRLARASTKR